MAIAVKISRTFNLYDFISLLEHKRRYFEKWKGFLEINWY